MSPGRSVTSPRSRSRPPRWTVRTRSSPLSVVMPGNAVSPTSGERGGRTTSATPERRVKSAGGTSWRASTSRSTAYCALSVRACSERSGGSARGRRSGTSRGPRSSAIATVPTTSGTPTSAKEKKPKLPTPAAPASSATRTFTGDPVSTSSEPAWAANASGISSRRGARPERTASRTVIGSSAATAPLGVRIADRPAERSRTAATSRVPLVPAAATRRRPAHVVTPAASSASLTTNSDAMKITVGSPKPANACATSITPVAASASAAPSATIATGSRFHTNSATAAPRTRNVTVASLTQTGQPGPSGMPEDVPEHEEQRSRARRPRARRAASARSPSRCRRPASSAPRTPPSAGSTASAASAR